MPARTIIYVDAFNFYYGAVRGTAYKWLDLELCFRRLRPHDTIARINYFTALLVGPKRIRQHDRADRFVIVSGDSDLVPAVELAKARAPHKELIVYVPSRHPVRGAATELRTAADKNRTFPQAVLKVSQFPPQVQDGHGGVICKPPEW